MRVISKARLKQFWETPGREDAEGGLRAWYTHVNSRGVSWQSWSDVKGSFARASIVGDCVVFNIGGRSHQTYESVDADAYANVARELIDRFNLSAAAITLRENPRVLLNSWSAVLVAERKLYRAPKYEVEVIDRIGAGDAFSGGLIAARLQNKSWEDALRFATAASALKHSIPGDFCLISREEVEQLLKGGSLRVAR